MSYLISYSDDVLPVETLPAWKITYFSGEPARGRVYAYLRCYVHAGALACCATVFDSAPRPTSRFGFAFALDGNSDTVAQRYLFLSCAKDAAPALRLYEADRPVRTLAAPPARHTSGSDEQGEYWSVECEIPAEVLSGIFGRIPRAGDALGANAFLYDEAEAAFGAACPVPEGAQAPTAKGFGAITVTGF